MNHSGKLIRAVRRLGFPWETQDPFLFCVYHADAYPKGNEQFGPAASLEGRKPGNDFTLKDGWRMYHGTAVPGFPVHPHRGFETVTVVRRGMVDHSDSLGGAGRYGNGDVQWMTAGRGIQHSEMFPLLNMEEGNPLELFQIWLNLPKSGKMSDPFYTMLWKEQIPVLTEKDPSGRETRIEIMAGSIRNLEAPAPAPDSWASDPEHQVAIWYIEMEAGAEWNLPEAGKDVNRSLFFFEGEWVRLGENKINEHCALELAGGLSAGIINGPATARFLFLQGKPIGEPVVSQGPFVMNYREEIQQTYADYQETRFGGWPWPRPDQVHGRERGRFAIYPGGEETFPPGTPGTS